MFRLGNLANGKLQPFISLNQLKHHCYTLSTTYTLFKLASEVGPHTMVDRVFAVHAGSREFDSHRRHMSERFFISNRPGYPHQCALNWKKVVLERRSVIAVSRNVSGGARLIKLAKLYTRMQNTTYTKVLCLIWFRTLGRWPH